MMKVRSAETYWLLKNGLTFTYPSLKEDVKCDVLVIGGGITGALMAFQLTSEGYDTVLIDKNDVSMGSTSASTAILQYELDEQLHVLIGKVGQKAAVDTYQHGIEMIDWLSYQVHHLGFDCGFAQKNSIYFARTDEDIDSLMREYQVRKDHGFGVQWLSSNELLKHYQVDGKGAILSDKAATVDAYALAHQLIHYCVSHRNLRVYDHTPMKEVTYEGEKQVVLTEQLHEITCKRVVYTTGYETQKFLAEPVANLISTYALVSEPLAVIPPAIATTVFWDTASPYFYMRSTSDNRIMIGGADEQFTNPALRDLLIDRKEEKLLELFRQTMPDMAITADFSWAGTFGVTKDSMPYIGTHPDHGNSFFVLGYGGNGITFSLMAMQMLSDEMAGRPNKFNDYFKFNR
jgi:glycine/D-amino acid oxidase-like deaminating enzyme